MRILFIYGTRPEAIKLLPVIEKFKKDKSINVKISVLHQHQEMLNIGEEFFIKPEFKIKINKRKKNLINLISIGVKKIDEVINKVQPDVIFIQGDTTTAFIGALSGFYNKVKVAHIEAGIRSKSKYFPFPEEINRKLIDTITDFYFVHSNEAVKNLNNEGIYKNIWKVGNTGIDALKISLRIIKDKDKIFYKKFNFINFKKRIILITGHRRENFGKPFEEICKAIQRLSLMFENVLFIFPVHLNPEVQMPVKKFLSNRKNIKLMEPLKYPEFIWLMKKSYFILTDSGGIQEEAPVLGKPVLVMREVTERIEGIKAKVSKLIGTKKDAIIENVSKLLSNDKLYKRMAKKKYLYGDGKASERIYKIILKYMR